MISWRTLLPVTCVMCPGHAMFTWGYRYPVDPFSPTPARSEYRYNKPGDQISDGGGQPKLQNSVNNHQDNTHKKLHKAQENQQL